MRYYVRLITEMCRNWGMAAITCHAYQKGGRGMTDQELLEASWHRPLMQEYLNWVNYNGRHITAFSSIVLNEFIRKRCYTSKEYDLLAQELGL